MKRVTVESVAIECVIEPVSGLYLCIRRPKSPCTRAYCSLTWPPLVCKWDGVRLSSFSKDVRVVAESLSFHFGTK